MAWDPNGSRIVACGNDATVSALDVLGEDSRGPLVIEDEGAPLMYGKPWVLDVSFSRDGSKLATATSYQRLSVLSQPRDKAAVRIWDTADGRRVREIGDQAAVTCVVFSPDGGRLAVGGVDGSARIWDAADGRQLQRVRHDGAVSAVVFSPDGTRLATGGADGRGRIWNAATGLQLLELPHDGAVSAVAFSPNGSRLATGSADNSARIWDVAVQ